MRGALAAVAALIALAMTGCSTSANGCSAARSEANRDAAASLAAKQRTSADEKTVNKCAQQLVETTGGAETTSEAQFICRQPNENPAAAAASADEDKQHQIEQQELTTAAQITVDSPRCFDPNTVAQAHEYLGK
jgi:hypothetical protein